MGSRRRKARGLGRGVVGKRLWNGSLLGLTRLGLTRLGLTRLGLTRGTGGCWLRGGGC